MAGGPWPNPPARGSSHGPFAYFAVSGEEATYLALRAFTRNIGVEA